MKAGIVLKTEFWWNQKENGEYYLISYEHCHRNDGLLILQAIPAPSMAEVWRELPEGIIIRKLAIQMWVWIDTNEDSVQHNTNPTDALINLLIWIKVHKGE